MPTTKSDLIEELAERLRLSKGKAEQIVKCIFDSMTAALQQDERIEIRGFGSFEVRSYKAYEGRNPRTGETVHVAPKRLPFFKVGKELRERINGEGEAEPESAQRAAEAQGTEPAEPAALAEPADTGSWPTDR
jgi:integration host factor subunit beta